MSKDDEICLWGFELAVRDALHNRQFSLLRTPGCAWGLDDVREGDLIALFLGAQVSFVVREVASEVYILVGECYVHGIMDCEAMQDAVNWQVSLRDIVSEMV
jgi:hypothetical protein